MRTSISPRETAASTLAGTPRFASVAAAIRASTMTTSDAARALDAMKESGPWTPAEEEARCALWAIAYDETFAP